MSLEIARSGWLSLLVFVPLWWWWVRPGKTSGLLVAKVEADGAVSLARWRGRALEALPQALRATAMACLILVLCQPRLVRVFEEQITEGVGITFAIDLSTSMWAEDMAEAVSRLDAAKETVNSFLQGRSDDVGLVAFAGEALTRLPLTHDSRVVEMAVDELEIGLLIDGTDVANAIAAGAGLLKDAPHRSKVLILLTDGAHNQEGLMPAVAARAASMFGVKIYPIAIGENDDQATTGMETVLTQVARITGGQYFRATDVVALDSISAEIDRLETVSEELAVRTTATPLDLWLLLGSVALLLAATVLRASRWGIVP